MAPYRLITTGLPRLAGPPGTPALEPLTSGLLVMLAVHGASGVAEDELLLRLAPSATPGEGRQRLALAAEELERRLGAPVDRAGGRWRIPPGVIDADLTLDPAHPPAGRRRRAAFLRGFELRDAPEFREWADSIRAGLRQSGWARARRRRLGRLALAGVATAALAGVIWRAALPEPVPFTRGDPVLLANLENATGDSLLDHGLTAAAGIGLQQSGHIQLVSRQRIAATLRRMQVPADTPLSVELAREVAVRDGIRYVVGIRAERQAEGYRLTAEVLDASNDRSVGSFSEPTETRSGMLAALDRLLGSVRAHLGEPAVDRRARAAPLPEVTTPSLEALRSYAVGAEAWSAGRFSLALESWERAVALDTGFAMALSALGGWYRWHNRPDEAQRYYQEALRRSARLTEWERLTLEEAVASQRGDYETAIRTARTIAERFPRAGTWYDLGTTLLRAGRAEEAADAFQLALGFEPGHVNAHINLATARKALGRIREALESYERARVIAPAVLSSGNVAAEYGYALWLGGRPTDAEAHFRSLLEAADIFDRTLGHRGLGYLALAEGRFDAAVGSFRRATEASRQQGAALSLTRGHLLEGLTLLLAGDSADARRSLREAARLSLGEPPFPAQFLALVGHGLVRGGLLPEAASVLERLRATADTTRLPDRESAAFLTAELLVAQGRPLDALPLLQPVRLYPQPYLTAVGRSEALVAGARIDAAVSELDRPLEAVGFGSEGTFDWFSFRGQLARMLADLGRRPAARAVLDDLSVRWANGDSGSVALRALRDLRAQMAR